MEGEGEPTKRTYKQERAFIKKVTPWKYEINEGFVDNMFCKGVEM